MWKKIVTGSIVIILMACVSGLIAERRGLLDYE